MRVGVCCSVAPVTSVDVSDRSSWRLFASALRTRLIIHKLFARSFGFHRGHHTYATNKAFQCHNKSSHALPTR